MGEGHGAIWKECGTSFEVNEGSSMIAMPFRCDTCGGSGGGRCNN